MVFVIIVLALIVLIVLVSNIKIVPQAKAYTIERLGSYQGTWQTGLHFKIPLIEKIARKVTLKEQVVDFEPSTLR